MKNDFWRNNVRLPEIFGLESLAFETDWVQREVSSERETEIRECVIHIEGHHVGHRKNEIEKITKKKEEFTFRDFFSSYSHSTSSCSSTQHNSGEI